MLYPTLPADDLAAVFASDTDDDIASIRAGTQNGLALLVLGMLLGDDMIEMRLRDAIQHAGLSYGEDIDVTLALRRGPLPTPEQFAAQLDAEGLSEQTFPLFEYFLHQPETDSEELEHIASKLHADLTPEEKAEIDLWTLHSGATYALTHLFRGRDAATGSRPTASRTTERAYVCLLAVPSPVVLVGGCRGDG